MTTPLYRADGLLELGRVATQKLVLVGAGSLGSMIMENLAYPWKQIVIADPDMLGVENVERHLLPKSWVGKPKVEGIRAWLVERGVSEETILAYAGPVQDILYEHTDASFAIVSVDNKGAKRDVDTWARACGIPELIGGVYPRGNGGHYAFLPNPREICYGCLAHLLGEDVYVGKKDANYGLDISQLLDDEGNLVKVPSLRAPVAAIAAQMAMLALNFLGGGEIRPHVLYQAFGWESVLTLSAKSPDLRAVAGYIAALKNMGVVPNMRLVPVEGGRLFELFVNNGSMPVVINRWADCPNHQQNSDSLSLEEI